MKCTSILIGFIVCHMTSFSQVGIGTATPNSQSILDLSSTTSGLLVPRMTNAQKLGLGLTAEDAGMLIFQTDNAGPAPIIPKGLYTFDGTSWVAPVGNGTLNGQTIKWDGSKWIAASNFFNSGSSIGIGTTAPQGQLHVHSGSASDTRIHITYGSAGSGNGLALGVNPSNASGFLATLELIPLSFMTNNSERMRIDADGNVGINKTNPSATLDVNGSAKVTSLNVNGPLTVGVTGTQLNSIIRYSAMIDIPAMISDTDFIYHVEIPNVTTNATVLISPSQALEGIIIGYARVSDPGWVEIKFMNMAHDAEDPDELMFYITVFQ